MWCASPIQYILPVRNFTCYIAAVTHSFSSPLRSEHHRPRRFFSWLQMSVYACPTCRNATEHESRSKTEVVTNGTRTRCRKHVFDWSWGGQMSGRDYISVEDCLQSPCSRLNCAVPLKTEREQGLLVEMVLFLLKQKGTTSWF